MISDEKSGGSLVDNALRVMILTRTFPPDAGAVGHLVNELAESLVKDGFQLTIIAAGAETESSSSAINVVRVGGLPFSRQSHLQRAISYLSLYPAMLWAALRQRKPDVIITTTDPPLQAVIGVLLRWKFRSRLLHWCQDLYPEMAEEAGLIKKNGIIANVLRWISTFALRAHDGIISIGRCMTQRLLDRGLDRTKIHEIPNWTDPEWIRPVPTAENSFVKTQQLEGRFVVVYSGNMGIAHRFSEILEAAALLEKQAPDVVFLFIGDGPRRAEVERHAQKSERTSIRFLPSQPWKTLPGSLSAGQVHLVSLRENLAGLVVPSKFYGGMAAGRPCLFIGPPESEVARLIQENGVGMVVQTGAELVAAILEYRGDPERLQREQSKARELGSRSTVQHSSLLIQRLFADNI